MATQAPPIMGAPEVLIERLNRGVRKRNAKWAFVREQAFGDALKLRRFRLGNGLTVLTLIDRAAPTVSYHTWFRVGSRHERPLRVAVHSRPPLFRLSAT